jgi:hypothetical protein
MQRLRRSSDTSEVVNKTKEVCLDGLSRDGHRKQPPIFKYMPYGRLNIE